MLSIRQIWFTVPILAIVSPTGCQGGCGNIKEEARRGASRLEALVDDELSEKTRKSMQELVEFVGEARLKDRYASAQNLRKLATALREYHDAEGHFPPAFLRSPDGQLLLSWRVLILPYLGEQELFEQFKLVEAWNSPHNEKLLPRMPAVYAPPGMTTDMPFSTYYRVFTGPGTVFEDGQIITLDSVEDGPGETLLVFEAGEPVPWTKPNELAYQVDKPLPKLGMFKAHFLAVYCSGGIQGFLGSETLHEKNIRGLLTRNGGEKVWQPKSGGRHWDFDD